MESIPEVTSAEKKPARVIQFGKLPLCADCRQIEDGMIVDRPIEDVRGIDPVVAV